jgi:hypothetical protein
MNSGLASLSTELISLIIAHLVEYGFDFQQREFWKLDPRLATVSLEWCTVVERHTFSTIRLSQSRLADFDRIVRGHRRALLRQVELDVVLDSYDIRTSWRYESCDEKRRNNLVFTNTFQNLFAILNSWPLDHVSGRGIKLSVQVFSPSDVSQASTGMERLYRLQVGEDGEYHKTRFEESDLSFVDSNGGWTLGDRDIPLPEVHAITELDMNGDARRWDFQLRQILPTACSLIVAKLPRLRRFSGHLLDRDKKNNVSRILARNCKYVFVHWKSIFFTCK